MATFSKDLSLSANPGFIPQIAQQIRQDFQAEGFEVMVDSLLSGGADISISKGGLFKAVLGMKTALKVTLTPEKESIHFNANVGIFGQQFIPTVITMFFLWPVLITQIWGIVSQAELDDKALASAQRAIAKLQSSAPSQPTSGASKFCPNCGKPVDVNAKFCSNCGASL